MNAGEARFWERVRKGDDCWEWTGSRTAEGYGHLRVGKGWEYAHRLAYLLSRGPIPEGADIDHLCRNRGCCNPDHLEAVSHLENVRRGLAPYGLRTTCKHGHDITDPQNVYTQPNGQRRCRVCAGSAGRGRTAENWPPTHCPQGHEFTPENTYRTPRGGRRCVECNRARSRAVWARKRAAR